MHVVYWIHDASEVDVHTEGYVGVSGEFERRISSHRNGTANKNTFTALQKPTTCIEIIFEGDESSCYAFEESLRPKWNIGWNFAPGGYKPPSPLGNKERAAKAAESLKGRKILWGAKISSALKGREISAKWRANMSKALKGRKTWNKGLKTGTQSAEVLAKRSASMKGKNARKVRTPLGDFSSIQEAADAHNLQHATLHARIRTYKMPGYEYID